MDGLLRQLALNAQLRSGLGASAVIWAVVAAIASTLALLFLLIAAFVWLSHRYDTMTAGVVLGALFLAIGLIAILACVLTRRRNIERARRELELRGSAATSLLDPKLIAMGYQVGQAIGWRRLAGLAGVGLLAAGLAREWRGRQERPARDDSTGSTS
jgi:Ca2+/Na+ antiporter